MATSGSAGCELFAAEERAVEPHSPGPVYVHLEMEIPPGYYGRIPSRSSLARYHFIDIGGGVIDSDFRGKLIVILLIIQISRMKLGRTIGWANYFPTL